MSQGGLTPIRKLRVAYMLPHHNITGGMKCLVEHIRLLRSRGHKTIAVHRWEVAATLLRHEMQVRAVGVNVIDFVSREPGPA